MKVGEVLADIGVREHHAATIIYGLHRRADARIASDETQSHEDLHVALQ